MDGFSYFWLNYPRHEAKKDARKAWDKLAPSLEQTNRIVAAVVAQIRQREIKVARLEWVPDWPYASSWLRGERWTDEVAMTRPVVDLAKARATMTRDEYLKLVAHR